MDYSPTGKEFVAASFDRTIRIFPADRGRSRDIYHGKRMQMCVLTQQFKFVPGKLVFCRLSRGLSCCYSADSRFVISGSADFCIRLWKSKAWECLGPVFSIAVALIASFCLNLYILVCFFCSRKR